MRRYFLARHVHMCQTTGGVIFLDLRSDEYFGLTQLQAQALGDLVSGWPIEKPDGDKVTGNCECDGSTLADNLVSKGLLTSDASGGRYATLPSIDVVEDRLVEDFGQLQTSLRVRHVLKFFYAWARVKGLLRCRSLEKIVEGVCQRKSRSGGSMFELSIVRDLTTVFRTIRPFVYTPKRKCLFDSLVLVEFLALYGVYPTWVIGVNARPFLAHSWVQIGKYILNGAAEYARRFTPILVI